MQEAFFEYLANVGLAIADPNDLARVIVAKPRIELEKLIDNVEEFIPEPAPRIASPFEFLANGTYSGAPTPCARIECRTERIEELAYFAALYADKVWVPSPFRELKNFPDDDRFRVELFFYIHRIQSLRPLFDAGLMELTPSQTANLCQNCYARMIGKTKTGFEKSFSKLKKELEERYIREVDYYVETRRGKAALVLRGPSTLIDEHFGAYVLNKAPRPIMDIAKKAKSPILLSRDVVRKHHLPRLIYEDVLEDILNQNYYSIRYGTGYLTQRDIDLQLIDTLATQPIRDTNALLSASFSHELPVVGGIKLQELVRVRKEEGEAFQIYRDALSKAIKDAKNDDPRKMKQAFRDIVKPEINRVNAALDSAKKALAKEVIVDTAVATGFVAVGLFTGILPPNIGQIVALLGGYHFFQRAGTKLAGIALEPPALRNNSFYFLWKVMKHGKTK